MKPNRTGAFLSRLAQDSDGATLAIAAASVLAIMGVVGGAIDIGRSYMAESRLQQACDAGALAARKAMAGETLTTAEKNIGYRFFDFNFPANSYGVQLTSRTYSQPSNQAGTPQAVINGVVVATVPTTIMRIFGKQTIDLNITCSSKMDIANADVAMVLDVTGSMTSNMRISSSGTATEDRIIALHKAVKAFYTALGPGRAGGDLSKGRIRYAFVPYGVVVNAGHLLTHDQMVDNWTYQSREAVADPIWGWTAGSYVTPGNSAYGGWGGPPDSYSNDNAYNTFSIVSGGNNDTFTMQSGLVLAKRNTSVTDSANCSALNTYGSYNEMIGLQQTVGSAESPTFEPGPPPVHPASSQAATATQTRDAEVTYGYRYRWSNNGGTNACWLERASKRTSGSPDEDYTETRTAPTTRSVTWQSYTGYNYVYGYRNLNVSGLKGTGGTWNNTLNIPALHRSGGTNVYIRRSGSDDWETIYTGGSAQGETITWRGCVEERQIDNTITGSTTIGTIPSNAYDLDVNRAATTGNDATRWRPWLWQTIFAPGGDSHPTDEQCPAPALKLQEIGNYNTTLLTTPYPNLFQATSGSPASFYYPYTTSQWGTSSTPAAERTKNSQTIRNYIERITSTDTGLTDGTIHDAGFIWGLHLVSGEGMFAAENPDRFNGQVVSRNIVFMTDGEINPGEERYVYSGYNRYDGRLAPASTSDSAMKLIHNRRLRILCEAAKQQGITVWVVVISDSTTQDFSDLEACASSRGNFKSATTSAELVASFTTIAQSIGGLRISQ